MDFLFNMNILGVSREGVVGWGRGAHVDDVNILRWMDVGNISKKVFNEGEDILEKDYDDKEDIFENFLDEVVDILEKVADEHVDISAKVFN